MTDKNLPLLVYGEITHVSERPRTDGQGLKYGIRVNDEEYKDCWLNGFGHNPYKKGEIVQVWVTFNGQFYNIVEEKEEAQEKQVGFITADQIPSMPKPKAINLIQDLPDLVGKNNERLRDLEKDFEEREHQRIIKETQEVGIPVEKVTLENTKIWQKTILEQNRALLMSKAVDLACMWKSNSTKAVKSIYHELLIESEQSEVNLEGGEKND